MESIHRSRGGFVYPLYSVVEDYRRLLDQMDVQVGEEGVRLRCVRGDRTEPKSVGKRRRREENLFQTHAVVRNLSPYLCQCSVG